MNYGYVHRRLALPPPADPTPDAVQCRLDALRALPLAEGEPYMWSQSDWALMRFHWAPRKACERLVLGREQLAELAGYGGTLSVELDGDTTYDELLLLLQLESAQEREFGIEVSLGSVFGQYLQSYWVQIPAGGRREIVLRLRRLQTGFDQANAVSLYPYTGEYSQALLLAYQPAQLSYLAQGLDIGGGHTFHRRLRLGEQAPITPREIHFLFRQSPEVDGYVQLDLHWWNTGDQYGEEAPPPDYAQEIDFGHWMPGTRFLARITLEDDGEGGLEMDWEELNEWEARLFDPLLEAPCVLQGPVIVEFEREFNLMARSAEYEVPLLRHRNGQPWTQGEMTVLVHLYESGYHDPMLGDSGGFTTATQPQPVTFADGESVAWLRLQDTHDQNLPHGVFPHYVECWIQSGEGYEIGPRGNQFPVYVVAQQQYE